MNENTIILNTRPTAWGARLDANLDAYDFDNPASDPRLPSSPSLGPSQSASQQGVARTHPKSFMPDVPIVSKYFTSYCPAHTQTQHFLPARTNTPPLISLVVPQFASHSSPMHHLSGQNNAYAPADHTHNPGHALSELSYDILREDPVDARYTDCNIAAIRLTPPRETSIQQHNEYLNYDYDDPESPDRYAIFDDEQTPMDDMYFDEYDRNDGQDMATDWATSNQQDQGDGWTAEVGAWDDEGEEWNDSQGWDQDENEDNVVNDVLWNQVDHRSSDSMGTSDSDELDAARFQGGRELLCGIGVEGSFARSMRHPSSSAEEQVARALNGHWRPQRL